MTSVLQLCTGPGNIVEFSVPQLLCRPRQLLDTPKQGAQFCQHVPHVALEYRRLLNSTVPSLHSPQCQLWLRCNCPVRKINSNFTFNSGCMYLNTKLRGHHVFQTLTQLLAMKLASPKVVFCSLGLNKLSWGSGGQNRDVGNQVHRSSLIEGSYCRCC